MNTFHTFEKAIILTASRTESETVTQSAQVNWVGAAETREAILAQSDRWINALKGRAKGRAAQWQLRDSL